MYTPIDNLVYVYFEIILLHIHIIADNCKKEEYGSATQIPRVFISF